MPLPLPKGPACVSFDFLRQDLDIHPSLVFNMPCYLSHSFEYQEHNHASPHQTLCSHKRRYWIYITPLRMAWHKTSIALEKKKICGNPVGQRLFSMSCLSSGAVPGENNPLQVVFKEECWQEQCKPRRVTQVWISDCTWRLKEGTTPCTQHSPCQVPGSSRSKCTLLFLHFNISLLCRLISWGPIPFISQ